MLAGLFASIQLFFPAANLDTAATSFGRVRPVHTNAVIFAFVGNGIFMGVYYSLQRLCKARMFSDKLSYIHFWGWQLIIVAAAISLPLAMHSSGLPIGVQLAATHANDHVVLQLAAALEEAMPWAGRVPPIHASTASSRAQTAPSAAPRHR
jgi:cbb3-type cytochrome oxidase subunit 1